MAILEVIKCDAPEHTLVWQHPAQDFNTHSTLIVDESQVALFYRNGQIADVFGPGRYVLSTQNIPLLRKLLELPTGGVSSFSCRVVFISLVEAMSLKWGLNSKVTYMEPVYQIPVAIGVRGEMSVAVSDPENLLVNLLGTRCGFSAEELRDYFRSLIVMHVKSYVTKVIMQEQMNIFTIDSQLDELATALRQRLAPQIEPYGVELRMFTVDEIILPEDDPMFQRVKRSISERTTGLFEAETRRQEAIISAQASAQTEMIGAQGHRSALDTLGTNYQQERQFNIAETMATNVGSGDGLGSFATNMAMIPGAMAMGSMTVGAINASMNGYDWNMPQMQPMGGYGQPYGAAPGTAGAASGNVPGAMTGVAAGSAANGAGMTSAGAMTSGAAASGAAGGAASAGAAVKHCAGCGTELPMAARFCHICGQQQPKVCPHCGQVVAEGARFCSSCGTGLQ